MPAATGRGTSNRARSRGRSSTNGSSAAARTTGARSNTHKKTSSNARRKTASNARASNARASNARSTSKRARTATNGQSARDKLTSLGVPIATATIGVAGGVLIGRTAAQRARTVLGIPVPTVKVDLAGIGQQVGEAARQFGKLANEVRTVREKAEQLGRAVS